MKVGQKRVCPVEAQPPVELLEKIAQGGVCERCALDGGAGTRRSLRRAGELAHRVDLHLVEGGDRLPRPRHDAADLLHLVAEEVDAHGIDEVAREDVERAATHGKRAGAVKLPGVRVAARDEFALEVAKLFHAFDAELGKLASRLEDDGHVDPVRCLREPAHERAGACHHHDRTPLGKRMRRLEALGDDARRRKFGRVGEVGALREPEDALVAEVGRHIARKRDGCVLACHHHERRLRTMREPGGDEKRARRGCDAERSVLARVELPPERVEASRLLEREGERVNEHGKPPDGGRRAGPQLSSNTKSHGNRGEPAYCIVASAL